MATSLPKWSALHTIGSNSFGFGVDGGGLSYVAAGDYFWETAADGGPVTTLRAAIQAILSAAVASTTVSINDSTGVLQVVWGSGSHSLQFNSSASAARCGSSSTNLSAATQHVMSGQVKGIWLPNVPGSNNGSVAGTGLPESDRKVTLSRSGAAWATSNTERRRAKFQFRGLTKAKMLTADETTTNSSLETFWRDALNYRAGIFRHHPDRTVSGTYTTWQSLLTSGLKPTRMKGAYDAVWDSGEVEAIQYVHVATGGGF